MAFQGIRRAWLALASVAVIALAGCGSGTIESQLAPTRVVSFGDAFSDIGQSGGRYTINDLTQSNWTEGVALSYGLNLTPASAGGTSYAVGNARIVQHPDAAGVAATPTISEQIATFLNTSSFKSTDVVLINGGYSDIIAQDAAFVAGTQTSAQFIAAAGQAGRDLGAQVRRLVQAGAKQVVVVGVYDLGKSPWAVSSNQVSVLSQASSAFNQQMLVSIVDLGANVLSVDAAFLFNLMVSSPGSYGMTNSTNPVCNSIDAGPGIGIGANKVNSRLCTASTLTDPSYGLYLFADPVYPSTQGQSKFGAYAFSSLRSRF